MNENARGSRTEVEQEPALPGQDGFANGKEEYYQRLRNELIEEIQDLNNDYKTGALTREQYLFYLNREVEGKTRLEWLNICDRYLEKK